ncbi:hypothetical protein [Bacillus sp. FJAT-27231]|nr:hypothetical protein [Bacillus sp. FJAT-27231]
MMALANLPTFYPSKSEVFLIALPLIIFIFFFLEPRAEDTAP